MKKKKRFLAIFLYFLSIVVFAQNQLVDSIKKEYDKSVSDTARSLLLKELGFVSGISNKDSSILFYQRGVDLAKGIGYKRGIVINQIGLATQLSTLGDAEHALQIGLEAVKTAETTSDTTLVVDALKTMGDLYYYAGDIKKSQKYLLMAMYLLANEKYEFTESNLLINISLGDNYEKLNILDSAKYYINRAFDIGTKNGWDRALAVCYINFGNIFRKMGQLEIAMANYRQALPFIYKNNSKQGICEVRLGMARIFQSQGLYDSAFHYADESYKAAAELNFLEYSLNSASFLADLYKELGWPDSAYRYLSVVISVKDKLFDQQKLNNIKALEYQEELRQQERSLVKLREQENMKINLQFAGIAIGLLLVLVVFVLLSHSIIVNERFVRFAGVLSLLLVFEFINLWLHPFIESVTHHSPLMTLAVMVCIAALLIPLHHRIEKRVTEKMVEKNKKIRLATAKKIVANLEGQG